LVKAGLLLTIIIVIGGSLGCGESLLPNEKKRARKAARVARENRELRRTANRRAVKVQRQISRGLVLAPSSAAGCEKRVAQPLRPVEGVLPVACGNFGTNWPLTIEYGFLRCERGAYAGHPQRRVVFMTPDGADYAVSDDARWVGYPTIAPIFRDNEGQPRYRNALTRAGLRLCGD
jgi:hypothetical protein